MSYSNFANDVKVGEKILIDDGKLIFEITKTNQKNIVHAKALIDGVIKSNKGVNLPNTYISLPALTNKDKEDAIFAFHNRWTGLLYHLLEMQKI
jgi:pyruvate kinase